MIIKRINLIIVLVGLFMSFYGCQKNETSYEKDVNVLRNDYDVDIYVYGYDLSFRYQLETRKISNLSLIYSHADYTFIILNLNQANAYFTEADYQALSDYLSIDHYKLIYVNIAYYYDQLHSYDDRLVGELSVENLDDLLLIDEEIPLAVTSTYSDSSSIVHMMIQDIKFTQESSFD